MKLDISIQKLVKSMGLHDHVVSSMFLDAKSCAIRYLYEKAGWPCLAPPNRCGATSTRATSVHAATAILRVTPHAKEITYLCSYVVDIACMLLLKVESGHINISTVVHV